MLVEHNTNQSQVGVNERVSSSHSNTDLDRPGLLTQMKDTPPPCGIPPPHTHTPPLSHNRRPHLVPEKAFRCKESISTRTHTLHRHKLSFKPMHARHLHSHLLLSTSRSNAQAFGVDNSYYLPEQS